jgi:hypothetical protein
MTSVTRQEELDARGRRLLAALAAVLVRDNAPELRLVRAWLNNWSGLGLIVVGMEWQGSHRWPRVVRVDDAD